MIALIDNYDSFSYNLYQLIGAVEPDIKVFRNDGITVEELMEYNPQAIVLSPGPGKPSDAGICIRIVKELGYNIPILGVCLGHQAICEAFGATVSYAKEMMHGKTGIVTLDTDNPLFEGMDEKITAARYHSLAVLRDTLPPGLEVIAESDDGEVMAVAHKTRKIYGVQFHPESVMTPAGISIMRNFIRMTDASNN